MTQGTMEDINEEMPQTQQPRTAETTGDVEMSEDNGGEVSATRQCHTESLNTVSTNDQSILFEKESRIKINYKKLDSDLLDVKSFLNNKM